jgi:hypothetical protein
MCGHELELRDGDWLIIATPLSSSPEPEVRRWLEQVARLGADVNTTIVTSVTELSIHVVRAARDRP